MSPLADGLAAVVGSLPRADQKGVGPVSPLADGLAAVVLVVSTLVLARAGAAGRRRGRARACLRGPGPGMGTAVPPGPPGLGIVQVPPGRGRHPAAATPGVLEAMAYRNGAPSPPERVVGSRPVTAVHPDADLATATVPTASAGLAGRAAGPLLAGAPPGLAGRLAAAGVGGDPGALWTAWLVAVPAAGLVVHWLAGPGAAGLLLIAAVASPLGWLRLNRGRAAARYEAALPDGLEAVARALRAGCSLVQALSAAAHGTPGDVSADLRRIVAGVGAGEGLVTAIEGWAHRRPLPGVRLAAAALCLGVETGGAEARAVDGVAQTLRQRLDVVAEVRALSSQARASALVIALAPVAFGALAVGADRPTAAFVLETPLGLAMLAAGLALDGLGAAWMARLTRVEAPELQMPAGTGAAARAPAAGWPEGDRRSWRQAAWPV